MINIIVAMTKERVIGRENSLLWHISEDLKNFKKLTSGQAVIMGRKTYESMGKLLPNRHNIVVSSSMLQEKGIDVCRSLEEAIHTAQSYGQEIFVIGGESIYRQALPFAERMYISYVKNNYPGDAYFPEFNEEEWSITQKKDFNEFELIEYERKAKF